MIRTNSTYKLITTFSDNSQLYEKIFKNGDITRKRILDGKEITKINIDIYRNESDFGRQVFCAKKYDIINYAGKPPCKYETVVINSNGKIERTINKKLINSRRSQGNHLDKTV